MLSLLTEINLYHDNCNQENSLVFLCDEGGRFKLEILKKIGDFVTFIDENLNVLKKEELMQKFQINLNSGDVNNNVNNYYGGDENSVTQLKSELKAELKAELRQELRQELKEELEKELREKLKTELLGELTRSSLFLNKFLNEASEEAEDFVPKSLLETISSTVVSESVESDSTSPNKMIEKLGRLENEVINSNRISFDLEKHLLEQKNILLQQKLLLMEQQEVLIKEIREVNAKLDFSPFSVLSSQLDELLNSTAPSISSDSVDSVDYGDWLKIKWLPPYDDSSKTFTRSFYIHPTVLAFFKLSYRDRTTQKIAINEAMLDYCMKAPEVSRMIQRVLNSPDELHSLAEFDSDSNLDE